jgi:hypothetical protein
MNQWQQSLALKCGPAFVAIFGAGFMLAGFVPPLAPSSTPTQVAAFYRDHTMTIRSGLLIMLFAMALFIPWVALISEQLKRIPGVSTTLIYTQLGAGIGNTLLILLPVLLFSVTAFRPDRDPNMTFMLNDLSWIVFIMPFCLGTLQWLTIAIAIFSDTRDNPLFPRWVGYYHVFCAIAFETSGLLTFFKTGPLAWNGLLSFYLPFLIFFVWFVLMFIQLRRAIARTDAVPAGQNA